MEKSNIQQYVNQYSSITNSTVFKGPTKLNFSGIFTIGIDLSEEPHKSDWVDYLNETIAQHKHDTTLNPIEMAKTAFSGLDSRSLMNQSRLKVKELSKKVAKDQSTMNKVYDFISQSKDKNASEIAIMKSSIAATVLTKSRIPFSVADLEDANLRGADLSGGIMHRTNLEKTNLAYTNLSGAFLLSSTLDHATLEGAVFEKVAEIQLSSAIKNISNTSENEGSSITFKLLLVNKQVFSLVLTENETPKLVEISMDTESKNLELASNGQNKPLAFLSSINNKLVFFDSSAENNASNLTKIFEYLYGQQEQTIIYYQLSSDASQMLLQTAISTNVIDLAQNKVKCELKIGAPILNSYFFGEKLIIVQASGIGCWDASTGNCVYMSDNSDNLFTEALFYSKHKRVVAANQNSQLIFWELQSQTCLHTLEAHYNNGRPIAIAVDKQEQLVASAGGDQLIKIWSLKTYELIHVFHSGLVQYIQFVPILDQLITINAKNVLDIWDLKSIPEYPLKPEYHLASVNWVQFSPDSNLIASASSDSTIKLWNANSGELEKQLQGHIGQVYCLEFFIDKKYLISAGQDKTIKTWDYEISKGECVSTLETDHGSDILGIQLSHDDRIAITCSKDGTVKYWELGQKLLLKTIENIKNPINSIAVIYDPLLVVAASNDHTIFQIDDSFKRRNTFKEHNNKVTCVKFSLSGQYIASSSDDGEVILWDTEAETIVERFNAQKQGVCSLAYSLNDRMLLCGGADGTIAIFDLELRAIIDDLEAHEGPVKCLNSILEQGEVVSSGLEDNMIKVWTFDMYKEKYILKWATGNGKLQLSGCQFDDTKVSKRYLNLLQMFKVQGNPYYY